MFKYGNIDFKKKRIEYVLIDIIEENLLLALNGSFGQHRD
jgi:hypothetical protein